MKKGRVASVTLMLALRALACDSQSSSGLDVPPISLEDASVSDSGLLDLPDSGEVGLDAGNHEILDGGADVETPVDFGFDAPRFTSTTMTDPDLGMATATASSQAEGGLKTYVLSTTSAIRAPLDGRSGVHSPRTVAETSGQPVVRTGNDLFDGLYALAVTELFENAVEQVRDGSFADGAGVNCPSGGCFETGRDWHYVWTRDTAFAAALGIAPLDPGRTVRSLQFKLSERRDGSGDLQIVQDTGTGGAWPVSTDRVSWSFGAQEALKWLPLASQRDAFAAQALEAMTNTLEHDRVTVRDPDDGLYFGETSFLDWREQTYPSWTATDPTQIAATKSLSTNLLHMKAMAVASQLASREGKQELAQKYAAWAEELKGNIRGAFQSDLGTWSSFLTSELSGTRPTFQMDALSVSLAVIFGALSGEEASQVIATYPLTGKGVPVIWPEQQQTPIYHNRAHWPFVTAFFARAAALVSNDRAFDFAILSLIRSAGLNLTNMENFELMTGRSWLEDSDPSMSGPVVNSQRQLWSVGGYLGAIQSLIFGIQANDQEGLTVLPRLTSTLRYALFPNSEKLRLESFPWRGGTIDVEIRLPEGAQSSPSGGFYTVSSVQLDGVPVDAKASLLGEGASGAHQIVVTLSAPTSAPAQATFISTSDIFAEGGWKKLFAPKSPTIPDLGITWADGHPRLTWASGESDASFVVHDVYRDGALVASSLPGQTTSWTDAGVTAFKKPLCYTVRSRFVDTPNASHDAKPVCFWGNYGTQDWHIQEFLPDAFTFSGGGLSDDHGRRHLGNSWGAGAQDYLKVTATAAFTGPTFIQLVYANATSSISTGITCGVKFVAVTDLETGTRVGEGYVAFPTLGEDWTVWRESTLVRVNLVQGKSYEIRVASDDGMTPSRAVNMSAFRHFQDYTGNGGNGGRNGTLNDVNIALLKLLSMGE